ncbi:hypothetical protein [Couchioplanes caeruleus]|nr:hypothetical protein [Couchioplanes caeruleus]ROP33151.1 hypothetical protein EDD30_6120 [Couchioplanes caeruleus]
MRLALILLSGVLAVALLGFGGWVMVQGGWSGSPLMAVAVSVGVVAWLTSRRRGAAVTSGSPAVRNAGT